ncbi:CYTOKININ-INDEPENDENT 1 [Hibiscus trionum]|uniref:histidine kinase n=1 Tax=Hibiscus trionum TaxID=183268 RepID=A0A9W7LW66_HIBTR|nr:CYTOKININ-INDEPENDENT 1 [Hibiscus trionum]
MKSKLNMQNHFPKIILRPICSLIILGVCGYITVELSMLSKETEDIIMRDSDSGQESTISSIDATSRLLPPLNSSALNLARSLSSLLNGSELSFDSIQKKIAPTLFVALSTIPNLSQISYIGLNGLVFSYYNEENNGEEQKLALFSNTSFSSHWYSMPVNRDNGKLYGMAITSKAMVPINATWLQEALNQTKGVSYLGKGWNEEQDDLFFTTVAMDGSGVISVGFPVDVVIDHFAALDFSGGYFHLATVKGDTIVQSKLPNAEILVNNRTVSVHALNLDGSQLRSIGNFLCESDDGKPVSFHGSIMGNKYTFYCSTIQIAGVQSVYVLAYPRRGLVGFIEKNSKLSLMLLVLMFICILVSFGIFIFFSIRAAKREMFLCAAFVKQMNATQQAERKSMFKTQTYSRANHDIRSSLAAITTFLDHCHVGVNPNNELAANLAQIKTCTKDLLDILNSVLKMSKIEAGKMVLEEEEFNLAQLLEDVVDIHYPSGLAKGIDVILDPCDGSINKLSLVRGDRVKLKQILLNLLNNAIKYTTDGHVSVRAVVKKRSFEKKIIASNGNRVLKCLSQLFCKKEDIEDIDALHRAEQNLNKMEFEFEVDDTGKGIPKDKQASIYEEFFQVKESDDGKGRGLEEEGCGLGLGIVQSIVRLMDGEIGIVEKEPGERGTCFRFTVMLTACQPESLAETSEDSLNGFHPHFSFVRSPTTHSHVILNITGEERKRVLKRYIENLNIKVTLIKQGQCLHQQLENLKQKLDISYSNSLRMPESSLGNFLATSASSDSSLGTNDTAFGIKGGTDSILPQYTENNSRSCSTFIVLVIDSGAGVFSELLSAVANFKADIPDYLCKVVWLRPPKDDALTKQIPPSDYLIYKPFHGSRVTQVLHLLPERKGTSGINFPKLINGSKELEVFQQNWLAINQHRTSSSCHPLIEKTEMHEITETSVEKFLNEKRILVVEDNLVSRLILVAILAKHGAEVEVCTNGKEAFDEVCKILKEKKEHNFDAQHYDCIIMDCQMPVMDGYEATKLIRMVEKSYGVHIPVIALTAHCNPEEKHKTIEAGMDFHLNKPFKVEALAEIFQSLDTK